MGAGRRLTAPPREAGFTLVELIVSLGLFALIAAAGAGMVDGLMTIQARTAGRLERLGDLQRALFALANDIGQASGGPISGGGGLLRFSRPLPVMLGLPQPSAYLLSGDRLVRRLGARGRSQVVLTGVAGVRFRFFAGQAGWIDRWPPTPEEARRFPQAIEATILLAPAANRPGGTLRRVIPLVGQP